MSNKVIFHIDVNSAFLSWEAVYRLNRFGGTKDLRDIPSAVSGSMAMRRGIILAKSIPAKSYGIQTGEAIVTAMQKCPNLVLVQPNYTLYEKSSHAFIEILRQYSPTVEQYSVDEAFVDMSGTEKLWGDPVTAADRLRRQVYEELGFTVNIGVSDNKLLAKMASDFKKPDLVHTLFSNEMKKKMWPLPVSELFYVGRATVKKLFSLGINTIGDLAAADPALLRSHLKKHGEVIWGFANGIDVSIVQPEQPDNKGYGNTTTIAFDVTDAGTAKMILLSLAETVAARLRKDNVRAGVIAIGIKNFDLSYKSHQTVLENATNITDEIHKTACILFDELWDGTPIRLLGIHTSRVRNSDFTRQLNMFDNTDYEKLEKIDETADIIREQYGIDALKRAVFISNPIDHMSGGISREKWKIDYSNMTIE